MDFLLLIRSRSTFSRASSAKAVLIAITALALCAIPPAVRAAACATPAVLDDGWQRIEPAAAGFDEAALCQVLGRAAQSADNLHGIVVVRHGQLVVELYRTGRDKSIWSLMAHEVAFGPEVPHDMRSISKSVVGLLFGIVQQQGKIGSLDTPVLTLYPHDLYPDFDDLRSPPLGSPERNAITIEHLLTMSSGLEWNESLGSYGSFANDETRLYWFWSPYHYALSRAIVAPAGSRFDYNGGGTAVLADITTRAAGMGLRELAGSALFEPLGIRDWEWIADPHRRPLAFAGLRMRPRDLAKIGRLMLDHGRWQGRQIVPAEWVEASMRPRIETGDGLQYGYQWWAGQVDWHGQKLPWAAGFGNGGQRLFVVPGLDLAVVVTAGTYNDEQIGRSVNKLFREIVATVADR